MAGNRHSNWHSGNDRNTDPYRRGSIPSEQARYQSWRPPPPARSDSQPQLNGNMGPNTTKFSDDPRRTLKRPPSGSIDGAQVPKQQKRENTNASDKSSDGGREAPRPPMTNGATRAPTTLPIHPQRPSPSPLSDRRGGASPMSTVDDITSGRSTPQRQHSSRQPPIQSTTLPTSLTGSNGAAGSKQSNESLAAALTPFTTDLINRASMQAAWDRAKGVLDRKTLEYDNAKRDFKSYPALKKIKKEARDNARDKIQDYENLLSQQRGPMDGLLQALVVAIGQRCDVASTEQLAGWKESFVSREDHEALRKEHKAIREENETLRNEFNSLKESLKSTMDKVSSQQDEAKKEKEAFQRSNQAFREKIETSWTENETFREKIDDRVNNVQKMVDAKTKAELINLETRITQSHPTKEELSALEQKYDDLAKGVTDLDEKHQSSVKNFENQNDQLHKSVKACSLRHDDLVTLETRVDGIDQDFRDLRQGHNNLKTSLEDFMQEEIKKDEIIDDEFDDKLRPLKELAGEIMALGKGLVIDPNAQNGKLGGLKALLGDKVSRQEFETRMSHPTHRQSANAVDSPLNPPGSQDLAPGELLHALNGFREVKERIQSGMRLHAQTFKNLETVLESLQKSAADSTTENKQFRQELLALSAAQAHLKRRYDNLQTQSMTDQIADQVLSTLPNLKNSEAAVVELQRGLATAQDGIGVLQADSKGLRQDLDTLCADGTNGSKPGRVVQLEARLATQSSEQMKLNLAVSELNTESHKLRGEYGEMQRHIGEHDARLKALHTAVTEGD